MMFLLVLVLLRKALLGSDKWIRQVLCAFGKLIAENTCVMKTPFLLLDRDYAWREDDEQDTEL